MSSQAIETLNEFVNRLADSLLNHLVKVPGQVDQVLANADAELNAAARTFAETGDAATRQAYLDLKTKFMGVKSHRETAEGIGRLLLNNPLVSDAVKEKVRTGLFAASGGA
jgi:hypothetical protein